MIIENVIVGAVLIAATLMISLIPIFMGVAQKNRAVKPVELFPPRGASPLDVLIRYYGKNANQHELFNPLMLYWAERGFITIEEDCKRGLKLTKIKDIERPELRDGFNEDTYEIEKQLFYEIFSDKEKKGDGGVFYTLTAHKSFNEFYEVVMNECKTEAKKVASTKAKSFSILTSVLPFVMMFFVSLLVGISLQSGIIMCMVFPVAAMGFSLLISKAGMPKGSAMSYFMYPFFGMFGGVPFLVAVYSVPLEAAILLACALAVALLDLYLISKKIDLRTEEQLKDYGRICGFKRFLLLAERAKLEELVEDDPEYFYEILPYCYVLGITEKLKPKFDRIIMDGPGWYLGELRDTLMF